MFLKPHLAHSFQQFHTGPKVHREPVKRTTPSVDVVQQPQGLFNVLTSLWALSSMTSFFRNSFLPWTHRATPSLYIRTIFLPHSPLVNVLKEVSHQLNNIDVSNERPVSLLPFSSLKWWKCNSQSYKHLGVHYKCYVHYFQPKVHAPPPMHEPTPTPRYSVFMSLLRFHKTDLSHLQPPADELIPLKTTN